MNDNKELLGDVYREIAEKLGVDTAVKIHQLFRGQQISFPLRLYHPDRIKEIIRREYNGSNARDLAQKYNYSEKTIRRIIKEGTKEKKEG